MTRELSSIPVLEAVDRDRFERDFFRPSRPLVLAGAARSWRAFERWSPDRFVERFGDRPVELAVSDRKGFDYTHPTTLGMSFREAAARIAADRPENDEHYYLLKQSVHGLFPELADDLEVPPWIGDPDQPMSVNLWFGGAGNLTPLHFDRSNNFLAQLHGRKQVTLCAPEEFPNLYPALDSERPHISRADVRDPDYERFPLLRRVEAAEAVLAPGDVLYIPPFWWHQVYSMDASISVNFWWRAHVGQCVCPAGVLYVPAAYDDGSLAAALAQLDRGGCRGWAEVAALFRGDYAWVAALIGATGLEELLRRRAEERGVDLAGAEGPGRLGEITARLAGVGLGAGESAAWTGLVERARRGGEGGVRWEEVAPRLEDLERLEERLEEPDQLPAAVAAGGKEG